MIKQFLRVKQIADQKFQRGERSGVLSEEQCLAEKRVDLIRESCSATGKKLAACVHRLAPDPDRRKKMPEAALAQCMEEWGLSLGESSILGVTLVDYSRIQDALASDMLLLKLQVEESVVEPLQNILTTDVSKILKYRKQLTKLTTEMDSAKSKYQSAQRSSHQATGNGAITAAAKAQSLKEESEDVISKVDQCKDSLTSEMFHLISREAEMSQLFVKLCQLQMEYHRKAFYMLEAALPEIETQIRCCPHQPVFGVPLEEHLRVANRDIAIVIESCICWLLETAMEEEGLFRIGGSVMKMKKMKSAFDAGFQHLIEDERDPHNIAGVLKLYLRSLPEPLLTYQLYDQWMDAAAEPDHETRLKALWSVVNSLPDTHFRNLRYIVKFLSKICQNSDVNKMSVQNVAIVIGPNLLWPHVEECALGLNMTATNLHSSIVDTLITYSEWFFPGECEFYVSTPTSPRHIVGFPDSSFSESQLSLNGKFSNGDSAVESMSSSPTNSSPKSPSPRVPMKPRKKAAPRPALPPKNPITRSLSCGGFQATSLARAGAIHSSRHATMSVSHENLLNGNYKDMQEEAIKQIPSNHHEHEPESVMQRPKSISKPPRSNRNGLPPVAERRSRSIGRPSVPPPDRPGSFSTSGSLSTDVSSAESEKGLDPEDISLSFESSESESYSECQMSFIDNDVPLVTPTKSEPLETYDNLHDSGEDFGYEEMPESQCPKVGQLGFERPRKESVFYSKMFDYTIAGGDESKIRFHSGNEQDFKKVTLGEARVSDNYVKDDNFDNNYAESYKEELREINIDPHTGTKANSKALNCNAEMESRSYDFDNNFPPSHLLQRHISIPEEENLSGARTGSGHLDHSYTDDNHLFGGTPTWFDHYGEDKHQSSTLWFSDHEDNEIREIRNYREDNESEERDVFDCDARVGANFQTIIEVGSANKHPGSYKSTVTGTSIKVRVNSETQDTKL